MQRYAYVDKGISATEPQFSDEAQNNKERKITKVAILREACLK